MSRRSPTALASGPLPREYTGEGTGRPVFGRLLAFALIAIISCDRPPSAPPQPRRLVVLATLYPLADIARVVGGDRVRVDWMLHLGDPIDRYSLDGRDVTRWGNVDLILADGGGRTETWAASTLDRLRDSGNVVTVDQSADAWKAPADGLLVLDPIVAGEYALDLARRMTRALPDAGETARANAAAFAAELEKTAAAFTAPRGAAVLTLSSTFDPLLARVGVRPVLVSADALHFTPRDAGAVRRAAIEAGVKSLVVPFDTPPGTLAYLEELTGLRAFTLDPLGAANYPQHSTYVEVLRFNLDQLRRATGP